VLNVGSRLSLSPATGITDTQISSAAFPGVIRANSAIHSTAPRFRPLPSGRPLTLTASSSSNARGRAEPQLARCGPGKTIIMSPEVLSPSTACRATTERFS
jgi:hypothetical protein